MRGQLVRDLRVRLRGRFRAPAVLLPVRAAAPLGVADVLELHLEGAEAQVPHRVHLACERRPVGRRRQAHGLPRGDRPGQHDPVGAGPLGQRAELLLPLLRVGLAPARRAVLVVAGRDQQPVLLGAAHEVQLGQALLLGPRLPVEALGDPAHRRGRPVADQDAGDLPAARGEQLAQRLRRVEEPFLADAGQGDRVAPAGPSHGEAVAAVRQVRGRGRAQRQQRLLRARVLEPYDGAPCGQRLSGLRLVQGLHARLAQGLAHHPDGVRIGVGRRHQDGLPAERYLARGVGGHRLRPGPYGGPFGRAPGVSAPGSSTGPTAPLAPTPPAPAAPAVPGAAVGPSGREGLARNPSGAEATAPPSSDPITAIAAAVDRFLPLSCTEPPRRETSPARTNEPEPTTRAAGVSMRVGDLPRICQECGPSEWVWLRCSPAASRFCAPRF